MRAKKAGGDFKLHLPKNAIVCRSIFSRARGLMFRSADFKKPLLFVFSRPGVYPIHSFFCRKFRAIWLLKGKVVEERVVKPWKFSVTPKSKFDELLEIPLNSDEVRKL